LSSTVSGLTLSEEEERDERNLSDTDPAAFLVCLFVDTIDWKGEQPRRWIRPARPATSLLPMFFFLQGTDKGDVWTAMVKTAWHVRLTAQFFEKVEGFSILDFYSA
jgi:hypothetical protein